MTLLRQTVRLAERHRRAVVVLIHVALVALSNYAAIALRFDGAIPAKNWDPWLEVLPGLLAIRLLTFVPFGLYQGVWRYTSLWDLRNIVAGVGLSSVLAYAYAHAVLGQTAYPRSVFAIDAILLICCMSAIRLIRRVCRELSQPRGERRVLIYGAGDAGEMIVRDMKSSKACAYEPVGFIDDDPRKVGQRIHGVPVLGSRRELPAILRATAANEVLLAIPSAGPETRRDVVRELAPLATRITTLPTLHDILDGRVTADRIRSLALEDLLVRAPVGLDTRPLRALLAGKRVMVTGAGGTIGSELSQQICAFGPARVIVLDRYENALFHLQQRLAERCPGVPVHAVIADVTDAHRIEEVFEEEAPEIVFHAAAHKHVPLMEAHPCEAVKNNVVGSRTVASAAARHRADRFILVSTDKAVNPTSVMGATKRVAELLVRHLAHRHRTQFVTVRFGNVLGSNGSVVPMFLDQIRRGGPVTVTHPDVERYFMLIPEAVQLVLHAAALDGDGCAYVLDMGAQIKLVDLARDIIRLSGFSPERDIPITFTGLRPGEKLSEELVGSGEDVQPSAVEKILRLESSDVWSDREATWEMQKLERLASAGDRSGVIRQLRVLVPTFVPDQAHAGRGDRLPAAAALATSALPVAQSV